MASLVPLILASLCALGQSQSNEFYVGAGIGDITGPAAEVNMMGYAHPNQKTSGIHLRQYSRAFVVSDTENNTVVFVSIDACTPGTLLKLEVVKRLRSMYGEMYSVENVCISGIHTHSGPAGYLQYVLYDVTSLGFVHQAFDAMVDGIVKSITRAHQNLKPSRLFLNEGDILDANINRSPSAYLNNPPEEKKKYKYNVDKTMTLLKMTDNKGKDVGMINWFAVHCTSMNNTNTLISGDNKGYASYLFESRLNPSQFVGEAGSVVAAFAQSNEGDVSPNTRGPHCQDTGAACDTNTSTCHGKNELCVAFGPGKDMKESTKIIGEKQYKMAMSLYTNAKTPVTGTVRYRHMYVNMSNQTVHLANNKTGKTCPAAMGYAFAAGTTDGPGAFNFHQGSTEGNLFWDMIRNFLKKPSKEQQRCHHPKPILLDTGEISFPYDWDPKIVSVQILQIGQLIICAVPAEFTTMAGRRLRDAVRNTLLSNGYPQDINVVIAGLSNDYASYVTTYEEYQIQRYEGGSTIYGPHTHQAYVEKFVTLARALAKNEPVSPGPVPPNLSSSQLSFLPPVIFDHAPLGKNFGDVLEDVKPQYSVNSTVQVRFVAGNPRNNLMTDNTFLTVNHLNNVTNAFTTMFTDGSWETSFSWQRDSSILGESSAIISWDIPSDAPAGKYKISHFGYYKALGGSVHKYAGNSSLFQVVNPSHVRDNQI